MTNIEVKELLESGVHFGHLTRKWDPNMAPYIYGERNGVHIIDLYKTAAKIDEAGNALKKIAASGRKILFVATKKQAKEIISKNSESVNMPYITERWPGGMLTNFVTIRKAVKKMSAIDRMKQDGSFEALSKRERLQINRQREKLEKNLGSISDMTRLPGAIFIVDVKKEHIAVAEAKNLNIPIFAMVDTNSDPRGIDYVIPSNDDASKSIEKVLGYVAESIADGLAERKEKKDSANKEKPVQTKPVAKKPAAKPVEKKEEVKTETKPAAKKPAAKPIEKKEEVKAETKPVAKKPAAKPIEKKEEVKAETKPVAKKAATKPAEKKEEVKAETKPAAKKTAAKPAEKKAKPTKKED